MILLENTIILEMKPIDVKDNTYINFKKEINDKNPKFKVGDHVRISKYKNIFAKWFMPNWSEESFLMILMVNKLLVHFMKMNYKALSKMNLEWKT